MSDNSLKRVGSDPLVLSPPKTVAGGMPAVVSSLKHVVSQAGLVRGAKALLMLNQVGGVDCSSCAWPDPDHDRATAEFCENGAKAIAWEADTRTLTADTFRAKSIDDLAALSDYEHGQLGRLVEPMVLRPDSRHYEPITWDAAFSLIADELRALSSPHEAAFYTSGRTSNEAAFLYQLFVRQFGTNNLPDCSNMCHESSGKALGPALGIGKGTVTLDDFAKAKVILVLGQNPGTNHPRMLTALQKAKRAGAKIVAINPLKEAGLLAFHNPQEARGLFGVFATPLADHYLQVKIGGDQALLHGVMKTLFARNAVDADFIAARTDGVADLKAALATSSWHTIVEQSGIAQHEIEALSTLLAGTDRIIACWAMGLTQHLHAVATIQDLVHLLLRGAMGKPGAGACPVRGHSNVQGDRTMVICEHVPSWGDTLGREFGFAVPAEYGFDTVESIRAMHDGRVKVFLGLGGNFLSATPDTAFTAAALRKCSLTVQVSIKLNRSHLVPGRTALILPCLARSDRDGQDQFMTTENSMGIVQMSRGRLSPPSEKLLSEIAIVCRLARAVATQSPPVATGGLAATAWSSFESDYDRIRDAIARVVPGFENYNERVRQPGGFYLPNKPREGDYPTATGLARFTGNALPDLRLEPGQLVMMTIRTHDQFNTTVYGLHDRYRGLHGDRRVILMNPADIAERGLQAKARVRLTSHFRGTRRTAEPFLVVPYDIPAGNCATYFPEANVLVPLDSVALGSNTPTSKWVAITIEPC